MSNRIEELAGTLADLSVEISTIDDLRSTIASATVRKIPTPAEYDTRQAYIAKLQGELEDAIIEAAVLAGQLVIGNSAVKFEGEEITPSIETLDHLENFARVVLGDQYSNTPVPLGWRLEKVEPPTPEGEVVEADAPADMLAEFSAALLRLCAEYGVEVQSVRVVEPTFEAEFGVLLEKYGLRYGQINVLDGELKRCTLRPLAKR